MPNYFVDSTTGNNGNSGLTMDLAWATLDYALESGGLSAGDYVWIRRLHNEIPTSAIAPIYDGTPSSPIIVLGWPRNSHSIISSDWTNGSTTVTIDDNNMDREKHCGRFIIAPNGFQYVITQIVTSSSIIIDREYSGTTVTNQAATISADTDYALAQTIDDSAWTIKKADYNSDADDIPLIDFNSTAYSITLSTDNFFIFKNLELKNANAAGVISFSQCQMGMMEGCLISSTSNNYIFYASRTGIILNRCIITGSGSGSSQRGVYSSTTQLMIMNSAIYGCGDNGIHCADQVDLFNVNIGVEVANGDEDIECYYGGNVHGRDVKLGGTNGLVLFTNSRSDSEVGITNYQKILNNDRLFRESGYTERKAVTGETPNKKLSDDILKITPSISGYDYINDLRYPVLEYHINVTAAAHTFKIWLYNDSGITLNDTTARDDTYLELEYISSYDDTTEYTWNKVYSTEIDILDAADADDWDYLQVGATPVVAGKVILRLYYNKYLAATNVFFDPLVVIT